MYQGIMHGTLKMTHVEEFETFIWLTLSTVTKSPLLTSLKPERYLSLTYVYAHRCSVARSLFGRTLCGTKLTSLIGRALNVLCVQEKKEFQVGGKSKYKQLMNMSM